MLPGPWVDRKEVWEVWVVEQAKRVGILKVTNHASHNIINDDSSVGDEPAGDTDDSEKPQAIHHQDW